VLPMTHAERFKSLGIRPPKGVLLHGPPGTGKTLLARACAKSTDAVFLKLAGPSLVQMYIGDGAKVRCVLGRGRVWGVAAHGCLIRAASGLSRVEHLSRAAHYVSRRTEEHGTLSRARVRRTRCGPARTRTLGQHRNRHRRRATCMRPDASPPPIQPPCTHVPMIRDAFEMAKEKCKDRGGAIIFIDEIDAIGACACGRGSTDGCGGSLARSRL